MYNRLEIPPEVLIKALDNMDLNRYTLLCGKCEMLMRRQTVMLRYEFGAIYSSEYSCSGGCGNIIRPNPYGTALGQFLERREI